MNENVHSLLRYGVLTASGIAGGRAGSKVDSAVIRAALRRNGRMNAISRLVSGTEVESVVAVRTESSRKQMKLVWHLALFLVEMVE